MTSIGPVQHIAIHLGHIMGQHGKTLAYLLQAHLESGRISSLSARVAIRWHSRYASHTQGWIEKP